MREIRTYGSEGGAAQANAPFLPLSAVRKAHRRHGEVSAIVANPLATVKKNKKFKQLSS